MDIGTAIAYKHGDRPMGAIRNEEKNNGIEESDQETQEGHEDTTHEESPPPLVLHRRFQGAFRRNLGAVTAYGSPLNSN